MFKRTYTRIHRTKNIKNTQEFLKYEIRISSLFKSKSTRKWYLTNRVSLKYLTLGILSQNDYFPTKQKKWILYLVGNLRLKLEAVLTRSQTKSLFYINKNDFQSIYHTVKTSGLLFIIVLKSLSLISQLKLNEGRGNYHAVLSFSIYSDENTTWTLERNIPKVPTQTKEAIHTTFLAGTEFWLPCNGRQTHRNIWKHQASNALSLLTACHPKRYVYPNTKKELLTTRIQSIFRELWLLWFNIFFFLGFKFYLVVVL